MSDLMPCPVCGTPLTVLLLDEVNGTPVINYACPANGCGTFFTEEGLRISTHNARVAEAAENAEKRKREDPYYLDCDFVNDVEQAVRAARGCRGKEGE